MTSPTNVWQAFTYYGVNLVIFGLVAFAGVRLGMALRKRKNEKEGE